jgi:hypothetical protein
MEGQIRARIQRRGEIEPLHRHNPQPAWAQQQYRNATRFRVWRIEIARKAGVSRVCGGVAFQKPLPPGFARIFANDHSANMGSSECASEALPAPSASSHAMRLRGLPRFYVTAVSPICGGQGAKSGVAIAWYLGRDIGLETLRQLAECNDLAGAIENTLRFEALDSPREKPSQMRP